MTPEKQAVYLINLLSNCGQIETGCKNPILSITETKAKECAKIAAIEIHRAELKVIENISEYLPTDIYTQAVIMSSIKVGKLRTEIEKL